MTNAPESEDRPAPEPAANALVPDPELSRVVGEAVARTWSALPVGADPGASLGITLDVPADAWLRQADASTLLIQPVAAAGSAAPGSQTAEEAATLETLPPDPSGQSSRPSILTAVLNAESGSSTRLFLRQQPVQAANVDFSGHGQAPAYQLLEHLGRGGMGVVHAARQTSLGRVVAIKRLTPRSQDTPGCSTRFLSEGMVTAFLEHPNIVPMHDLACDQNGRLFAAMKRVIGQPWSRCIRSLSREANLEILMRVADAVAYAHDRGIIHRDLKPDNIMVGDFGEVLVMDWGLALAIRDGVPAERLNSMNVLGGTPRYMAPESVLGAWQVMGPATDVYLLGGLLFECCTGQPPHPGGEIRACLMGAAQNTICEHPPADSDEVLRVALKALSTKPRDRYPTVQAFQAALRACQSHSESLALCDGARADVAAAGQSRDYGLFSRSVFRYQEALALWDQNGAARSGLAGARLAWARAAIERGDFDLAEHHLDDDDPGHAGALNEARAGQARRRAHVRQVRRLRLGLAAAGIMLVAGLSTGVVLVSLAQHRTAAALAETRQAKAKTVMALVETEEARGRAVAALQEAERSRQRAEAISDFLVSALRSPDPRKEGRTVTVLEVLEAAGKKAEGLSKGDPQTRAAVHRALGLTLTGLGCFQEALAQTQQALSLAAGIWPEDALEVLVWRQDLARLSCERGRYAEAEKQFRDILAALRRAHPEQRQAIAECSTRLATTLFCQDRFAEAETEHRAALDSLRNCLGPDAPRVLAVRGCLANDLLALNRLTDAEREYRDVVEGLRRCRGEQDPDTLQMRGNLATVYLARKEHQAAERELVDIVAKQRVVLGEEHPEALGARTNLAALWMTTGRIAEAEREYRTLVAIHNRVDGAEHPAALAAQRHHAEALLALGRRDEAESACRAALQCASQHLGPDHKETARLRDLLTRIGGRAHGKDPGF